MAVDRQFSGMVPQGLKKTPKRLGAPVADCARIPRGIMALSNGSPTPTPSAPLSSDRRDICRGMSR